MASSHQLPPSQDKPREDMVQNLAEPQASETLAACFGRFLVARRNDPELAKNQDLIIKQVLQNLAFEKKTRLSSEELKSFETELNRVVHINGRLPNFIVSESKEEENHSEEFENPDAALDDEEKYARNARNLLKYLVRGRPLCLNDGESYKHSPLAKNEIINTLLDKRDDRLLKAFRDEMQKIFNKAFEHLQAGALTADDEKQYEIFQASFLSAYPFMDPSVNELAEVPQKINGVWEKIPYRFQRFDISPKSGPLSWILEEEDRMYAYTLVSDNQEASSLLLLMGTTYPAGQGAGLAGAYNFYPRHSVGEAHDMTEVDAWLKDQKQANKKVKISGHSKGATMAMITAARHPEVVTQADCLNPAGLCGTTLGRLAPSWNRLTPKQKPCINVYAQAGDPVFPLEKGFLEGTHIYRVIPNTNKPSMNCTAPVPVPEFARKGYEAHIHQFAGRSSVLMLKVNTERENASQKREFFNDVKYLLNWLRFPKEYLELFVKIIARKAERFYKNHKKLVIGILILTALATCGILAYTGVLVPLVVLIAKPVLAKLGLSLSTGLAYGITAGLSVIGSLLLPPLLKLAAKIASFAAQITNIALTIALHLTAIILGSTASGLKLGFKALGHSLFSSKTAPLQIEQPDAHKNPVIAPTLRRVRSSSALALSKMEAQNSKQEQKEQGTAPIAKLAQLPRAKSLPNLNSIYHVNNRAEQIIYAKRHPPRKANSP